MKIRYLLFSHKITIKACAMIAVPATNNELPLTRVETSLSPAYLMESCQIRRLLEASQVLRESSVSWPRVYPEGLLRQRLP